MIPVETGNKQGELSDCPSLLLGESFQATGQRGEIQSEPSRLPSPSQRDRAGSLSVETKGVRIHRTEDQRRELQRESQRSEEGSPQASS